MKSSRSAPRVRYKYGIAAAICATLAAAIDPAPRRIEMAPGLPRASTAVLRRFPRPRRSFFALACHPPCC